MQFDFTGMLVLCIKEYDIMQFDHITWNACLVHEYDIMQFDLTWHASLILSTKAACCMTYF